MRSKEDYDGAEPSPTALALLNLQVLTHLRPDADRTARISQSIARFGTRLGEYARAVPMVLAALVGRRRPASASSSSSRPATAAEAAAALREEAAGHYRPFLVEIPVSPASRGRPCARALPLVAGDGARERAVGRVSLRQLHVPGASDDAGRAARGALVADRADGT